MTSSEAYAAFNNKGHGLFLSPFSKEAFKELLKDWDRCHANFHRLVGLKSEFKREYTAGLHEACHELTEKAMKLT